MLETISQLLADAQTFIWNNFGIVFLIVVGIYFTLSFNLIQFRSIKEMFKVLKEDPVEELDHKPISAFQAFTISAASRVGTGNIAGVAIAIATGGPGAVFWMWVVAGIGSATAFIEATLAQIYKVKDEESKSYVGGPAYYIEKGLNQKWLGAVFAILMVITFAFAYNSIQSNTIAQAVEIYNIPQWLVGVVLAIITTFIIFGGVHSIVKFTEKIVPLLAVLYLALAIVAILLNIDKIPSIFMLILESAFGLKEFAGGTIGGSVALLMGVKRGLFSNEAGEGSAPHAAATASVSHPVKQGLIQSLGVYFDTWLICTATAFLILLYPGLEYGSTSLTGIKLTQQALTHYFGDFGTIFLIIAIFLFAYSSVIGNYFYGETNLKYLTTKKWVIPVFRILVIGVVYLGAVADLNIVWNAGDFFMALITIINLIAILCLSKVVYAAAVDYMKQKQTGKDPQFKFENIEKLINHQDNTWSS